MLINHPAIPTKQQAKKILIFNTNNVLFHVNPKLSFLCYYVLTRPLLLCYPVLRLPCLPHYIKFLNSKFTYMLLLHYLCGYGKYEPWGRREAR